VSGESSKGYAMILPALKGGFQTELGESKFLLIEAIIEATSATETFQNGIEQKTSTLNTKLALGFKF
jgi:hypothetical protein